ncbi:hypothetical protein [uncultured Sneathiella sp.]|jgi:hypothetical protein|uniref:hypothetical protein n=1 Tax=uncultured Sneathiella sp. TaxID=879315 RepID=UPI0030DC8286|tara:strand:+ start:4388 stop:6028 length:1641 start_codon:yes stop_codon:yes gene_type:complete
MSDKKKQQATIQQTKEFQEKVVKFILDNDIRVIFYGEGHLDIDQYTMLPISLIQALSTSNEIALKGVYFEAAITTDAKTDKEESDGHRATVFNYFKMEFPEAVPQTKLTPYLSGKFAIQKYLYSLKQTDKLFFFGRNSHDFTRKTLGDAIATVGRNEVIVISIGAAHMLEATDSQLGLHQFFVAAGNNPRKRSGNYVATNDRANATFYKVSVPINGGFIDHYVPTDSLGLVDYFSAKHTDFGILAINGIWRSKYLKIVPKDFNHEDMDFFIRSNRSVRELAQRHMTSPNVFVARSYNNWTSPFLNQLTLDAQKNSDDEKKNDEEPNKKVNRVNARIFENFKTYDSYFSDDFFASRINERNVDFNEQLLPRQKRFIGGLMNYVFSEFLPETDKYLQEKKQSDILSNLYFTSILYLTSMPENDLRMKDPVDIFLRFPPVPKDVNAPAQDKKAENQDLPNDEIEEDSKDDASLGDNNPGMNDPRLAKKLAFLGGDSESDDENDSDAAKKKSSKDKASPPPVNPATPSDPGDNDNSNGMDYIDLDSDEDD